jgi:site-specific recombinase XerC
LSAEDERRLLAVLARAKDAEGRRDYLLFDLMLSTGIRVGSAVALGREDVDLGRRELRIRIAKGNQPERILLGKRILKHLERYVRGRESGLLFSGRSGESITTRHVHRRFRQWLKTAGITARVSPHGLRHRFGTKIYERTGDILLVKEALRHRSIASTLVYARANEVKLREVI